MTMPELALSSHVFRHIKKTWMDGDFVDPAAFRLRQETGGNLEDGLSVNWVEYFQKATAQEAIAPIRNALVKKGRSVGGESKFALLNVGTAKTAAAIYTSVAIVQDPEPDDPSHSLVKGYEAYNDQVAEELAKVVIDTYPARS
jgi:hypothetical protein